LAAQSQEEEEEDVLFISVAKMQACFYLFIF
jgi:hypothetical protein